MLTVQNPMSLPKDTKALLNWVLEKAKNELRERICFQCSEICPELDFSCKKHSKRELEAYILDIALERLRDLQVISEDAQLEILQKLESESLYRELGYDDFREYLESKGLSVRGNARYDFKAFEAEVLPLIKEHEILTPEELKQLPFSKLRVVLPELRRVVRSETPEKEKVAKVTEILNEAETLSYRELCKSYWKSKIPDILLNYTVLPSGDVLIEAVLKPEQFELFKARLKGWYQLREVDLAESALFGAKADAQRAILRSERVPKRFDPQKFFVDASSEVREYLQHFGAVFGLSEPERKNDLVHWVEGATEILNLCKGDLRLARQLTDEVAESWWGSQNPWTIKSPKSIYQAVKNLKDRKEAVRVLSYSLPENLEGV